MAKKGVQYTCPPKKFSVPADLIPLRNYATIIVNAIRNQLQGRGKK